MCVPHEPPLQATILDRINGASGPPLPPFQWWQNGAFSHLRAFIIALGGGRGLIVPFYSVQDCSSSLIPRIRIWHNASIFSSKVPLLHYLEYSASCYTSCNANTATHTTCSTHGRLLFFPASGSLFSFPPSFRADWFISYYNNFLHFSWKS